jgi:hypothetical protein
VDAVKRLLAILGCCSLALAQLYSETIITDPGPMLEHFRADTRLTFITRTIEPRLVSILQNAWLVVPEVTVITDRASVAQLPDLCRSAFLLRRAGAVYVVDNVPSVPTLIMKRDAETLMVQGGLISGTGGGTTKLMRGEPMVRNLATQMLSAVMQKAVLERAC